MMGYYTHHHLEVEFEHSGLIEVFRNENDSARFAIDENGECEESCKWYEHEKDLRQFSKIHPDVLFTLRGDGEEQGDSWIEYYKAGKMQRCKAITTYPPYDEDLLL